MCCNRLICIVSDCKSPRNYVWIFRYFVDGVLLTDKKGKEY